jgi:hypothetical protein
VLLVETVAFSGYSSKRKEGKAPASAGPALAHLGGARALPVTLRYSTVLGLFFASLHPKARSPLGSPGAGC